MKKKNRLVLLSAVLMLGVLASSAYALAEEGPEEGSDFIQEVSEDAVDIDEALPEAVIWEASPTDDVLDAELIVEDAETYDNETVAEPSAAESESWPSDGTEADTELNTEINAELSTESNTELVLETGSLLEEQAEGILTIDQVEEISIDNEIAPVSAELVASGTFGGDGATSDGVVSGHDGHNLTWTFDADGVLTISGNGSMGDFWSTEELRIRPWEAYIPEITKVVIEDGVTSVGKGAFHNHTALTSVTIPNSVYTIVCFSFNGCTSLPAIEIPDGVGSFGHYVFEGCTNLKNVTIPESVHVFGKDDFYGTPWLAAQGDFCIVNHILLAYQGTSSDIVIPDGVTWINEYAFTHNEYVKSVTVPSGDTYVDPTAFRDCISITDIAISEENPDYASVDGVVFNKEKTSLLIFPAGREGEYSIPEGILSIGEYAFSCSRLSRVTIPGSVTAADTYAFQSSALEQVTIPGSLQTVSFGMFFNCPNLNNVEINDGVSKLGGLAFEDCASLCTITLPSTVSDIGRSCFEGCENLTSILVENGSCSIYDSAATFAASDEVTVYGARGSTAEEYAGKYEYPFGLVSVSDPVLASVSAVPEGAKLTWNAVDGAVCYRILYQSGSGSWEKLADTTDTKYTWADGKDGTKYSFTVQCITRDGITALSGYDATGKSLVYAAPTKEPDTDNSDTEDSDEWYLFRTPVSSCKITLSKTKYTYNGKERKPSVTVKDGKKKLVLNTHYTISYKNNLNAGTASVVITGKGKYTGKVIKKFKIRKKAQKLKASVSAKSVKTGKSLKIKIKKSIGKITYKSLNKKIARVTSKGKVKGISVGKVKIVVKAAGDRNHKAASKTFLIKVKK